MKRLNKTGAAAIHEKYGLDTAFTVKLGSVDNTEVMTVGVGRSYPTVRQSVLRAFKLQGSRDALSMTLLAVCTVGCLLPFLNKAFHIDDPFYLWVAKHLHDAPLDFYGVSINWYGLEQPTFEVNQNPPLLPFYMALVATVVGWGEVGLHVAFLLPAVAAVIGTYLVARRFCANALLASLVGFLTPVWVVSSTTLMADVLMLAFYAWALFFWVLGLEDGKKMSLLAAAVLMTLSALTKYFGITLLPLLFLYSLSRQRRLGAWTVYFLVPVVTLILYELYTHSLYGRGLFLAAAGYAADFEAKSRMSLVDRFLTGLFFAGGCTMSPLFFIPFLWSRRVILLLASLAGAIAIAWCFAERAVDLPVRDPQGALWAPLFHAWIFSFSGLSLLLLPFSDLVKSRDPASLLLGLWVLGTFVFAAFVNWTTNGRALLPVAGAVGILVVRQMESPPGRLGQPVSALRYLTLLPALLLSLAVAWGDYRLASCGRLAATTIQSRYGPSFENLWFQGHWGFQYYMEAFGAQAQDIRHSRLAPGDVLALPTNNQNVFGAPPRSVTLIEDLEFPASRWIATMSSELGAGFYSSLWGPFPYAFGAARPECYQMLFVEETIAP